MSSAIRYFLYARKSSEDEDRQVQSIEDQKTVMLRFANAISLTIVAQFEEAHSAKEPGTRDVFNAMLERIERGEADGILCWNVNRLSRNPVDSGRLSWLLQRGVIQSIRTVDREYRSEDNVLLMAVETATANQYIIELSKNVKRGMREKAAKGNWPQKAPFGYRNITKIVDGIEVRTVEPDPEGFPLIRGAWNMMMTGAHSGSEVRDWLSESGFQSSTRAGRRRVMSRSSMYRMFGNSFYYGYFRFGGTFYKGNHTPMVTRSEFDRVQRILERGGARPQKHQFAFTGLIRCAACGCFITAERKVKYYKGTGRTVQYVYYHCTGRRGCSKDSVSESYLYETISAALHRWKIKPEFGEAVIDALDRDDGASSNLLDSSDVARRSKYAVIQKRLDRLYEMREEGELSAAEFANRKTRHQNELAKIDQEITDGMQQMRQNTQAIRRAVRYLMEAPDDFAEEPISLRREIASLLAEQYVLTLGKLRIKPDPLLAKLGRFEPQIRARYMVRRVKTGVMSPAMCTCYNYVRTLIEGEKLDFGEATKALPARYSRTSKYLTDDHTSTPKLGRRTKRHLEEGYV